jgi:alcohol dehydrogenase class IV
MAFAALASGICLANAGLGAVHGFAAALGAQFPAPHGAVCAALLPHVLAANLAALRVAPPETAAQAAETIRRYAVVGRILTGEERLRETEAADAAAGVAGELAREFAIPGLRAFGVTPAHAPEVAAKAKQASSMKGNPVALSDAALENILRAAL